MTTSASSASAPVDPRSGSVPGALAGEGLLYLSRADIETCAISPNDMRVAVEDALRASGQGHGLTARSLLASAGGISFEAKGGLLERYACLKWYGYVPGNSGEGLPNFWPMVALNDARTGFPLAVMDGTWISMVRTAAISAVAARRLAHPDSRSVAFIACGAQADSHLAALAAAFDIRHVHAYGHRRETAEAFAARAAAAGFEAHVTMDPQEAVAGADIVVTSVPHKSLREGFLDAAWLKPDCFVSMVDLGFSWKKETLRGFSRVVTDDFGQPFPPGGFNFDGTIEADLPRLLNEAAPGDGTDGNARRTALIFAGTGLADVAAGGLIFERACERRIGLRLPL